MKSRVLKTVLVAACALAPLAAASSGPAMAQAIVSPAQDIALSIGRGQLVTVPGNMADIFVSNETVADVQVKSQRQLYVFGKAGGETTVYASNGAGDIIWSANVRVASNIDSVDQMLTLAMPDANIRVATMGINTVLLTGTVAAPEDAAEAERLVTAFMGDTTNVVSRLRMATPLQVNLRVRFAEVSRSLVRALGVNLTTVDTTSGFRFGIGQGRSTVNGAFNYGGPLGVGPGIGNPSVMLPPGVTLPDGSTSITGPGVNSVTGGTTLGGLGRFLGLDVLSSLDLAEQDGLSTTLAEPNLTALSGETAEFLAGGEFPIPLSQGLGTTTIEYKNYGVSLAYTPTVLANGRISLRVRPEVSELTSQGAVTLGGVQVPALTVRRAETTVELGSGQSFMIAGLLSNKSQNLIDKAPGAGDIPILGALFRSTNFQRNQTELVIVVTPYLVRPVDDSEIRLPTDGFQVPDPVQQYLLMKDNNGATGGTRPMPRAAEGGTPPQVGQAEQVTPDQTADNRRRIGEETAGAEPASPGFSL
ncbi:type II and III secretion system protein family protein [Croceibacterium sp. LX-88]|uniref:Type II and III secretion system protein family protein n=1 Tax=Croceibacterium selenioxidans TaxID=2838833 RepID=A0ABS5W848_9SPHN|nr:type II and III secretion system protein family protein [Croceibacterium selenioxidans]MBT2134559.1 type II and III secretion system protein family protein [Croceibacterium selenioxidans]